jgi:hypothetical protein
MAQLQGAVLYKVELKGLAWLQANLDGTYISDGAPDWSERELQKLETTLKPLMDAEKYSAFQSRMKTTDAGTSQDKLIGRAGCYSENPTVLDCEYRHPEQLDAYKTTVLYLKLIELACSDAAIATGIARRGSDELDANNPLFGLAAALVNVLNNPTPCLGLAALPEQARVKLQKTVEQQKK